MAEAAPQRRVQRQRRAPSAEALAEMHDQNVMGSAAGFFCAVWAGWLMGEPFSSAFVVLGYRDPDDPRRYRFGPADAAFAVLCASKVVFVRACLARYVVRPLARARCPGWPFAQQQRLAAAWLELAMRLAGVCAGLWAAAPIWDHGAWAGCLASATPAAKALVLGQAALQLGSLAAHWADGGSGGAWHGAGSAWLALATLATAARLGAAPLAGAALAAGELPGLGAAAAECSALLGRGGWLRRAVRATLFVAMWTWLPALLYAAVAAPLPAPEPAPAWAARAHALFGASAAALVLLALVRLAAGLR
ncbi:hypothetical protein H4R18_003217 [Coemansia javaensis]|uniref:Uncharacterized protein n=1 Tax=Coemansia javaensis TaxID=2761396 RepID=A0A9W8LGM9_9FUNG|nr:hypothetical protein H4R18_003217 [Coemansia javaensis]